MRVVIADGHPTMRLGLRGLMHAAEARVIGEAGDGAEAVRLARETQPDLVILGLNLSGETDGIEAYRRIKGLPEPPRVLVYAARDFSSSVWSCLLVGADGYLSKRVGCAELLNAARRATSGEREPCVDRVVVAEAGVRYVSRSQCSPLTLKEREVLVLVLRRLSNAEIAAKLYLSLPTVKTHLRSILRKLGVKSRRELLQPHAAGAPNF